MNILIAEDAPSDRMLLKLHLKKLGHTVYEVSDGNELISYFLEHESELDVLIVDLNMPNKSGVEAVSEIRAHQGSYAANWIPIIFLSGSDAEDDILYCIEAGADAFLSKPVQHKVLLAKIIAVTRLAEMRKELLIANARLKALSTTDYLTNLPNRRAFENALKDEMGKSKRHDQPLSVAVLDIDHFKMINDTYGHDAGDYVLKELANRLISDQRSGDVFGRIGGEEFGLILPHTNVREAAIACERYRTLLSEQPYIYESNDLDLTVSVGVCMYDGDEKQFELIKRADNALYEAKNSGRNKVVIDDA
ncbi:diguanylate cyclase [Marinomonas ostreistagni]|uniref:diguanylate cyclase n=1 Tax=Marinomonas ostreistagni TaxID=359209 RepID=A0ABS0ZEZ3_9GAMM|nr:diguanylate cyclase [Marinomonas ostreistagni]MBJ7552244.1 diguanylate cyclase [Marinomonas ostreistagni]